MTIDAVVGAPVLLTEAMRPHGKDLDLIARPREFEAVAAYLGAEGFNPWRRTWARFGPDAAEAVELSPAKGWGPRRDHDGEALFVDHVPLAGYRHLVRPGAAVQLVLIAQSLLVRRGALPAGKRRRASEALRASGDEVWKRAAEIAAPLHLIGPLKMLQRLLAQQEWTPRQRVVQVTRALVDTPLTGMVPVVRQVLPHRIRPVLVSLSGPDGSGKSTQTVCLTQGLRAVGVEAASAWAPTTLRPPLPRALRAVSDRWRREPAVVGTPASTAPASAASASKITTALQGAAGERARSASRLARIAEHAWITGAALSNARAMWMPVWHHRRASVLVLDRFVIDADAKLVYWYGHRRGADIEVERRLFTMLAPTSDVTVLLKVRPETNHQRRQDEFDLDQFNTFWRIYAELASAGGVDVVDAERPLADVSVDVAETVWRRLP
jgi:thymidylate kinase